MTAAFLPEALEQKRRRALWAALESLADWPSKFLLVGTDHPTDEELDAIADACNEILNGIDEWLDDPEAARLKENHGGKKPLREGDRVRIGKATLKVIDDGVKKRARKP